MNGTMNGDGAQKGTYAVKVGGGRLPCRGQNTQELCIVWQGNQHRLLMGLVIYLKESVSSQTSVAC